jgi:hypothetical protein
MDNSFIVYGPKGNSKEIENILTHIFSSNMNITDSDKKPTSGSPNFFRNH